MTTKYPCSHPLEYRLYTCMFNTGSYDWEVDDGCHFVDFECTYCGHRWEERIKFSPMFSNSFRMSPEGWNEVQWEEYPMPLVLDQVDEWSHPQQLELDADGYWKHVNEFLQRG